MRLAFVKCHGSGNDFPLVDARDLTLDDAAWAGVARALADRAGPVGGDGLLLLTAGCGDAAFGMRMFNPDGSEALTCLNGLRCVARAGFAATGLSEATVALKASRAEAAAVAPISPGVATIRTLAAASIDPAAVGLRVPAPVVDAAIPGLPSTRAFTAVAMPNPHLIAFVDAVDEGELVTLGDWCEARPALLADRANVSFVEQRGPDLFVRTYERGVGLTDSCGSAMAAATHAAARNRRIAWDAPITVFNAGGLVRATARRNDVVAIEGNATFEWAGEATIDLAGATAHDLAVTARHDDEVAAWDAAIARLATSR